MRRQSQGPLDSRDGSQNRIMTTRSTYSSIIASGTARPGLIALRTRSKTNATPATIAARATKRTSKKKPVAKNSDVAAEHEDSENEDGHEVALAVLQNDSDKDDDDDGDRAGDDPEDSDNSGDEPDDNLEEAVIPKKRRPTVQEQYQELIKEIVFTSMTEPEDRSARHLPQGSPLDPHQTGLDEIAIMEAEIVQQMQQATSHLSKSTKGAYKVVLEDAMFCTKAARPLVARVMRE
ncbi:hypothetical protein BGZ47_011635 [Haplosporangium gracile]|nr:hypothetical protein BGZ47_011635 [Haplosporangium gracile]